MMGNLSYSELSRLQSFEERFEYLKLGGSVGHSTFGTDRHVNQTFYNSNQWRDVRNYVINRDSGCDLGVRGYEIHHELLIHHMNPMGIEDIIHAEEWITDPEFLITTTKRTHNAIHYGDDRVLIPKVVAERLPGDTRLW
jgi:hypothetical protein